MTPADIAALDPRLFWLRAEKRPNGCWEIPVRVRSFSGNNPYPRLRVGGRIVYGHRVAWVMATGRPIVAPAMVCHHCDNTLCVRPGHLYLGTAITNVHDRVRRRRGGVGSFAPIEEAVA